MDEEAEESVFDKEEFKSCAIVEEVKEGRD